MARKFSLDKYLTTQLKREIKNYNRRVKRAVEKGLDVGKAPKIIKYSEVKPNIATRKQYNKLLQDMREATAETLKLNKKGTKTIYERKVRSPVLRSEDEPAYIKALANIDLTQTTGRLPSEREWIAKAIGLEEGNKENIKRLRDWLGRGNDVKSMRWKENYLKAVRDVMNDMRARGDYEAVQTLIQLYDLISSMDLEVFLSGQLTDAPNLAIEYVYPPNGQSAERYFRRIIDRWNLLTR